MSGTYWVMSKQLSRHATIVAASVLVSACVAGDIFSPLGPTRGNGGVDGENDDAIGFNPDIDPGLHPEKRDEALSFSCDADARRAVPLRRLASTEYKNALRDVIESTTSKQTANDVMNAARGRLSGVPTDTVSKHAPFDRMDQTVSQEHVQSYVDIGQELGGLLTSSAERLDELLGGCSDTSGAAADGCIDDFIARFGRMALRHPLSADELGFYQDVYDAPGSINAEAVADVIAVMFNAPGFLYQVEFGADPAGGMDSVYELNDFEIATRLSLTFWQSTPDNELLEAAERGELTTTAGFETALDRVLSHPKAEATLTRFVRQWLRLDDLRALDKLVGDAVFDAFVGSDVPSSSLRGDMIADVTDSFVYHTLHEPGSLSDWLNSPYSFARSEELASIYGTSVWTPGSEPPVFPDGERAGLITRAAMLATGTANTRPIHKGVVIREQLLCDRLPPPPPNVMLKPTELSPTQTTREVVEALTEVPGSQCAGCHATQLNPLGYATENFDALGRFRATQPLFDDDGNVLVEPDVDTTSIPRVWLRDETASTGPEDLARLITESQKVEACFARQIVRFANGAPEDEPLDGCALEAARAMVTDGGNIVDALRDFAKLPGFRQRYVPADS